jgi:N-acyl-D-aspartate/D-glutamate deacylase
MRALFVVLGFIFPTAAADPKPAPAYLIENATVVDGTGKPGYKGSVLIRGDKIVHVGAWEKPVDGTVIDGTGLVVCPGFIDLHTHCDTGSPRLTEPTGRPNANYVAQGVTTVVTGNCGAGPVDTAKFFAAVDNGGVGTNVIHQVPHGNLREQVMKNADRPPTTEDLAKMESLVDKAMKDGAWGLSTGLIYTPGTYAKTDELIALAKVAGRHGGHYASHIRDEGAGLLGSIEEAIRIGKEGGCPVHVSHIKASGKAAHGLSASAVALIETARKTGVTVTADQYPYVASSTSLRAILVPTRYREGTEAEYVARLDDPRVGPKIRADLVTALQERGNGKLIQIARYVKKPAWQGKRIADVAAAEGKEPVDVVLEIERTGGAGAVNFAMSEEDVRVYMKQPWVATASDGGVHLPTASSVPHPRSYGTFPRKIGVYAVEEKLISLEQAVRSCSGLPADILRLKDRGYLKPECYADVVVFDPKTFRDAATFDKPHQYATGVRWVFVNGRPEIADGKRDDTVLAGRALRHGK